MEPQKELDERISLSKKKTIEMLEDIINTKEMIDVLKDIIKKANKRMELLEKIDQKIIENHLLKIEKVKLSAQIEFKDLTFIKKAIINNKLDLFYLKRIGYGEFFWEWINEAYGVLETEEIFLYNTMSDNWIYEDDFLEKIKTKAKTIFNEKDNFDVVLIETKEIKTYLETKTLKQKTYSETRKSVLFSAKNKKGGDLTRQYNIGSLENFLFYNLNNALSQMKESLLKQNKHLLK